MITEISKTKKGISFKANGSLTSYSSSNILKTVMAPASQNRISLLILESITQRSESYFLSVDDIKVNDKPFTDTQDELIKLLNTQIFN